MPEKRRKNPSKTDNLTAYAGCLGCLLIPMIPVLIWQIGYQTYFYNVTGHLDLSLPTIKFGASKTVKLCAERLQKAPYAENVHIQNNDTVEFNVNYVFSLSHRPAETGNVEWGQEGEATWSWLSRYVENDVKARCQGPVSVSYSYNFVRKSFHGGTAIPKP